MSDEENNDEEENNESKKEQLTIFLDNAQNSDYLVKYFDKYIEFLINNTLNSHIKGVVKH